MPYLGMPYLGIPYLGTPYLGTPYCDWESRVLPARGEAPDHRTGLGQRKPSQVAVSETLGDTPRSLPGRIRQQPRHPAEGPHLDDSSRESADERAYTRSVSDAERL